MNETDVEGLAALLGLPIEPESRAAVASRRASARAVVAAALERIDKRDTAFNCFTTVLGDSALAEAERIDQAIARGGDAGPLAGVPCAVKNLFDVAGVTTLAGSRIYRERPPAERDAAAVAALRRAGAVLVGCLNMDEYAFGFTTENTHYGPTRNPQAVSRCRCGGTWACSRSSGPSSVCRRCPSLADPGPLPLGVQLVAAPFMEESLFRVAARLEKDGVVAAPVASARC